jgi:nucleoporin POM152
MVHGDWNMRTWLPANSFLDVKTDGTYQLLSVKDSVCPGLIEEKADQFDVSWVARPSLSISETPAITVQAGKYIRDPVCEGEEDSFDISLSGKFIHSLLLLHH